MKIILTERQYKVLTEQPESRFGPEQYMSHSERQDFQSGNSERAGAALMSGAKKQMEYVHSIDPHTLLTIAQIGTAFIPVAGIFISAAIGAADAALYYKEGDKTSAGITAAFSMLPFIGKIPGVKEFGSKAMAALGSKVAKGIKVFTPAETKVLNAIKQNEALVKQELTSASKKISTITKELQSLKPAYVERFGQDNYENLLRDFLSGKADKQYFVGTLKSAQKAAPNLANFVTKFGIKFSKEEISQIQKLATEPIDDFLSKYVTLSTKTGPRNIRVTMVPKNWVAKNLPRSVNANMFADAADGTIYMVKDNVKELGNKGVVDILTHEFAHIKDPSLVASPKYMQKYSTEAVQGIKDYSHAMELQKLGFQKKAAQKYNSFVNKYYLNPNELIANNTMVLQSFATNTKNLGNVMNKNQILKGLDDIITFTKGGSVDMTAEPFKLLGLYDSNISTHFQRLALKPSEYRKFLSKLAQQAAYLKSQVKIAM